MRRKKRKGEINQLRWLEIDLCSIVFFVVIRDDHDNWTPGTDNQCGRLAYNRLCNCSPNKFLREPTDQSNGRVRRERKNNLPSPARIARQAKSAIVGNRGSCDSMKTWRKRSSTRFENEAHPHILNVNIRFARMVVESADRSVILRVQNKTSIFIVVVDLFIAGERVTRWWRDRQTWSAFERHRWSLCNRHRCVVSEEETPTSERLTAGFLRRIWRQGVTFLIFIRR